MLNQCAWGCVRLEIVGFRELGSGRHLGWGGWVARRQLLQSKSRQLHGCRVEGELYHRQAGQMEEIDVATMYTCSYGFGVAEGVCGVWTDVK